MTLPTRQQLPEPSLSEAPLIETGKSEDLMSVKIKQLCIYYRDKVALENAEIEARPGEILALIGPSGCGKSSLLSAINRLTDLTPECRTSGEILLNGENVLEAKTDLNRLRKEVGMVFQQPNPFPLSISENICFPLKEHGWKNKKERLKKMQSVLTSTGLWDEVKDRLHESALALSGGQQQRLCIARALALDPKLLLLDEPCSALDPLSTEKIEQLLLQLKGKITLILVTHNLAQARRVADQVAVCWVHKGCGCVIETGEARSIFENPTHRITEAYCKGERG